MKKLNAIELFLDLEATIIDNCHDFLFLPSKCEKIRNYIHENKITHITILSFAIDNEKDVTMFEKEFKEDVERVLNAKITNVLSVDHVMKVLGFTRSMSLFTFKSFGKQSAFITLIERIKQDEFDYVLIDDMVENATLTFHDSGNKIQLINIDSWETSS